MNAWTEPDTTPPLRMIECGSCGAGLPVPLGRRSVRCVFCGGEQPVPELGGAAELVARTASAEREGLAALREAHRQRLAPTGTVQTVAGIAWLVVPACALGVTGMVLFTEGVLGEGALPFLTYAALGLGALGWFYSRRWLRRRAERKAEELARQAHQRMTRGELAGRCPSCGGKVQVPDRAASLSCPFCTAPLLASSGMLVHWAEDAEERRLEWLGQAGELLDRVHAEEIRRARRAPVVTSVAVIGIAALAGGTTSMTLSHLSLTELDIVCRGVCRVDGGTCLKGGEIGIYLTPGQTKVIELWTGPGQWKAERVTVAKGERRVFVCPPTPDAPRTGW